jgi:hypothetical protein
VAFIVEHGGRVYVWADASGLKHVATEAPEAHPASFDRITANGFALYVATDMMRPKTWNVELRHVPRRHIDVLWDGDQPGRALLVDGAPFPV